MGGARKRAAPTAATQRPAKKRKSAEASLAKMKKIVDDEEAFSEDEKVEVKPLTSRKKADIQDEVAAESEGEDEADFEGHKIVAQDDPPVVAPGFRLWQTNSKLASKGELSQISKYDEVKEEFSHFLKVRSDEEFTLMPLIITQGPYKGRRVFMLEPTQGFRFFDFPPEIRNHIYSFLVEADDSKITLRTAKKVHEPRRPVMGGQAYDRKAAKWVALPQLFSTLLRANKQILREAAPILYGTNHFHAKGLGDLKIFLDRIGSMRKHLRHIHVGTRGFQRTKARPALKALQDATDLRTLSFCHDNLCLSSPPYYYHAVPMTFFVAFIRPLLRALHQNREKSASAPNVLDIVKVVWERCTKCEDVAPAFPESDDGCVHTNKPGWMAAGLCQTVCKNAEEHCKEVQKKLRKMLADQMGIEE